MLHGAYRAVGRGAGRVKMAGARRFSALALLYCLLVGGFPLAHAENWPGWRGPRNDGTVLEGRTPVKWSGSENVAWKTALPGKGHASPVIWGDAVFVTAALEEKNQRILMRLDYATGEVVWKRVVLESALEKVNPLNSRASSTPATDGKHVYVSFLDGDKMFVAAYDFDGKRVWAVRPGVFSSKHGYCSSPILWKDKVIVNGDHDGPAYILALNKETGKTVWKTPRPNRTRSYTPFIIREISGRNQLIFFGQPVRCEL